MGRSLDINLLLDFVRETWVVWCRMAPYLLLGFLIAGILYIWIKPSFIQRHLGTGRFLPVVKTALFGVPLPLCSCGVIPVAASLRRRGATKGATSAFLLSTPQTGVDSIAVTYSLLGGFFAVFRAVAALVSGLAGGFLISALDDNGDTADETREGPTASAKENATSAASNLDATSNCCGGACGIDVSSAPDGSSNGTDGNADAGNGGWRAGLRYGFNVLPRDIGRALAIGVIIAGAVGVFAPADLFVDLPGGTWTQMIFMMLAGIPVYVCATASVPVAAALILKGISPGAALVFLITGPATNAATISTIWKVMGRKTAVIYLSIVAVTALLSGTLVDFVLTRAPDLQPGHLHVHGLTPLEITAGFFLMGMLLYAYRPIRATQTAPAGTAFPPASPSSAESSPFDTSPPAADPPPPPAVTADTLTIRTLTVSGMHCSHCADTVRSNIADLPGVKAVDVNLESGTVRLSGHRIDMDRVKQVIRELGYKTP